MNYKVVIFITGLFLSCVSCSGKGNKAQTEHNHDTGALVDSDINAGTTSGTSVGNGSEANLNVDFDLELLYCSDEDRVVFENYIAYIEPFKSGEMSELIIKTAHFFLNKPYVASTLELEPEGLVVNLREFDCTTFVETVLALSRVVKLYEKPVVEDFCGQLRNIRYRRGTVGDYTSRIHYFSDWIYENETRGHIRDVTKEIGGESYKLKLNFMSSHPDSYKQLKSHPGYVEIMRKKETEISDRNVYSYIPETHIVSCGKEMKNGDIVCFVTDIEGLDISHVGFIYHDKGQLTFIHASTTAKKVIVNPQALSVYIDKNKRNIGVMIARPYISK